MPPMAPINGARSEAENQPVCVCVCARMYVCMHVE